MNLENNRLLLNQFKLGQVIPELELESIFTDVAPRRMSLKGKPGVILFFNLGCPGCIARAIPFANRLVYERGEQINVIGIHSNFESIDFEIQDFIKAKNELYIRFPIYRDFNFDTSFLNFGAGGTPHWIIFDAELKGVYSIFGSDPNNALLRLDYRIQELLNSDN